MEMNYFKKTGKMMVAACMLAGLPFIPGTVSASELQTQMMSVQMESTTLKELFDLIEEKFNYTFLIRNNDINLNERISIDMSNRSVEEILTTALKNQHADFVVNNNRIVVYKSSSNPNELRNTERMVAQQTITISGTIVDAVTGEPVIGANVLVKGTTNGTSTDFDGKFSLEAPAGATLVVSYIGYVNHEVKATSAPMTIRIKEDTQNLEEVVVVGYGVQKKESLTGAMQVVSNEKLLDATSPTVENLLSGKAPGVQVTSGGGQPGAAGKVVIRGKSTVNGSTDPLWIVDGVIVGTDAGSLNPADIESMSILKDAASTAIYGSQGANGVIVVTTKKGKIGKATINASVKMGVNQLHRGNMNMMNGEELYDYYKSFANQDALPSYFTEDLRNRNFDWWKEGTHLGFAQDYNVSVSGGSEKIKTYTSVGYYNEDGAVKGYDYKRYNLRFNVDYQATDWLTIKPKVWATRSDVMDQQQDLGAIMYVNFPWDSPYDENGDLIQQYRPTDWVNSDATNYLYDLQWNYEKKTSYEFMGNFDFDIKFTDWLTFASVNSYKYNNILFKGYNDPRSKAGEADNGLLQDKTTTSYRVYSNQLLRFNKVFDKHSINAILAYEWNSYTREIKDQTAASFAPGFSVADVATTPKTIKGSQEEWAVQSYLFNANYAYDNRYLLSFSFRRDGASNFGEDAKYGNFFSVSGGWNIHQEEFFKAKDWVQQLKLRASYGSVGNRPTELYSQYTLYAMSTGYNGDPGAVIAQKENKNLTWEKTYTAGVGIDAILFDRLTINLDYYNKKTTDLLYKVPLPGVTGITGIYRNVGSVKNNGFEVSLGVDILKGGDWNWSVAANLGLNRNKITELYGGKSEIITANAGTSYYIYMDKILTPGQDVDTWYGTEWAGVDPQTGAPLWYTTNEKGERITTSDYSEASKHQTILGKLSPDFYGGFSTNLSWKNIDLSAVFGYSVGGEIYNYDRSMYDSDGAQFSLLSRSTFMTYNELAPDAASQTETIFAVKFIASDWDDWGSPLGSMYAEIDGQGWGEVYASAKYMDLLHETGKNTDAREAFIHPQYKKNDAGDQIPAFRFVANLYTDGKISGYVYRQGETKEVGGKLIATVDDEEYTLTPVDVDNKRYSISYKGKTYVGDYDYLMLESQGNPKFYSYKCSKQEGYPHLYSPVISRLGELYLIRAEASAKLGNYTKALADLNTVRTRSLPNAGYKSLDATNAHELIMKERQLELAYEADRGFDVYRVGDTMKRHYPGFHDGVPEYPATSPLAIQYIPQSEINAYPGTLTQNP